MRFVPFRLDPSTEFKDNLNLINQNFNLVAENIDDFGPQTGTQTSTILAVGGEIQLITFYTEAASGFRPDAVLFDPKFSFRIDTDSPNYQFPDGISLTSGQQALIFMVINTLTPTAGRTAEFVLEIRNADTVDHSIHINSSVKVYSRPPANVFR